MAKMSFKVVETVEKNRKTFSVVPTAWEKSNVLFWPSNLKSWAIEKIRKSAGTVPDENWVPIPCKVKAMANSFAEGVTLEKIFASFTDTESEERFVEEKFAKRKEQRKHRYKESTIGENEDYNKLIDETPVQSDNNTDFVDLGEFVEEVVIESVQSDLEIENNTMDNTSRSSNLFLSNADVIKQNCTIISSQGISDVANSETNSLVSLLNIQNGLNHIKKEIAEIKRKQNNIEKFFVNQLAQINVKVDKLLSVNTNENVNEQAALNFTRDINFPLKQLEDIYEVENRLGDQDFKKEITTRLTNVCGANRTAEGAKSMYKLIDFLLIKFSWTGISKSAEKKHCFQKLTNIVELIFSLVFSADCRHSRQRNEEFLKEKFLKHTNQRLVRKRKIENKNPSSTTPPSCEVDDFEKSQELLS